MLGYEDVIAPQPQIREYGEEGDHHIVLGDDYDHTLRWCPSRLPAGRSLEEPKALFKKLDVGIIDEELRRMEAS
jgi:hypothetical protein